jgi:predicted ATPase
LALELAAARTRTMSVAEIAQGLRDPLALLTIGPRSAPVRQQTLRATLDWSYALLTSEEQILLRRLAVFVGGCTLEAAQAVCTDAELAAPQIPDLMDHLVSKSLLVAQHDQETTRFTMSETLRGYLSARLGAAGEVDALRARHRDWCLALTSRVPPELLDPDQATRLRAEEANLRAALHWTMEADQASAAGRLVVGLAPIWLLGGNFAEARALLTAVTQLPSASRVRLRYRWRARGRRCSPTTRGSTRSGRSSLRARSHSPSRSGMSPRRWPH